MTTSSRPTSRTPGWAPDHCAGQPGRVPQRQPYEPVYAASEQILGPSPLAAGQIPRGRRIGCWWPLLADDLFRISHDDWGKLRLHPDAARTALAAAVLAELIYTSHLTVEEGVLYPVTAAVPIDAVAGAVMESVRIEPHPLAVRDWMTFLATTDSSSADIYDRVARRMVRAGLLRAEETGWWWRRTVRFVPVDMNVAAWPWARLSSSLERGERLGDFDRVLGGLVLATGLYREVLIGPSARLESLLRRNLAAAPPDIRALIHHTETVISAGVITGV